MLESNSQVIFLLTYKLSNVGINPLTAREYSKIALKIRDADLSGPQCLMNMDSKKISQSLDIEPAMANRIRNLLDQGGTASLYMERIDSQEIKLITRVDTLYPTCFKALLLENTPPYICYVGNIEILSKIKAPYILAMNDSTRIQTGSFTQDPLNMIYIIDSIRMMSQFSKSSTFANKCIVISSLGLAKLIRYPVLRDLVQKGNTLIISTNEFEESSANINSFYLYLMSFALSKTSTLAFYDKNILLMRLIDKIRNNKYLKTRLTFTELPRQLAHSVFISVEYKDGDKMPRNHTKMQKGQTLTIYTIGHSNHETKTFNDLLRMHKIDILVDIRSSPLSKFSPQFNQNVIENNLVEVGINYKFMGNNLGGRPADSKVLNSKGKIIREYIEKKEWYQKGILNLLDILNTGKKVAIMCSEEDPRHCHRGYIVSNTLIEKGIQVFHIRGNGEVQNLGLIESSADQIELDFY